jgi:UDP-N-acetylmuramoyl-tripeptide--D-alanyl-D-alanine ligase
MRAALEALSAESNRRRYAVIGEMLELGPLAREAHRTLAEACASLDGVVCVGQGARPLYEALGASQRLGWVERANELDLESLCARIERPASVLVKGSNRVFWKYDFVPRLIEALAH